MNIEFFIVIIFPKWMVAMEPPGGPRGCDNLLFTTNFISVFEIGLSWGCHFDFSYRAMLFHTAFKPVAFPISRAFTKC